MKNIRSRPIILVSNSSWYLFHYRKLLIEEIKKTKNHILALAPYDSKSIDLSKLLIHIPWRMSRAKEQNLYSFFISFLRMLLLIRALKPKLIHSHTLQANFISSIICSLFGINCVLSFAGIGRFSRSKGINKLFFIFLLKIIFLFNSFQRETRFKYRSNLKRSAFIFQNRDDLNFIKKEISDIQNLDCYLIPGSGVPKIYVSNSNKFKLESSWLMKNDLYKNKKDIESAITFIYCARLLKSKGILIFLELSRLNPKNKFLIYGSLDHSTKDSLSTNELKYYKNKYKNVFFMDNKKTPLLSKNINFPILIVPSFYGEGFPRGIIEANTLSIPVIASKESAKKIPIKNLLYKSEENNPSSYVESVKKVVKEFQNKKLVLKLENARKLSIKYFAEEIIVKKTLKVYETFNLDSSKSYLINKDRKKFNKWLP